MHPDEWKKFIDALFNAQASSTNPNVDIKIVDRAQELNDLLARLNTTLDGLVTAQRAMLAFIESTVIALLNEKNRAQTKESSPKKRVE